MIGKVLNNKNSSSNTDLEYKVNEVFEEPKIRTKAGIVVILDINTVIFPFTTIDFSTELTAGKWKIIFPSTSINAIEKTGTEITFETLDIYGKFSTPGATNIKVDLTGAKLGLVQKMYHKSTIEPEFPNVFVKVNGTYSTTQNNIIYFEYCEETRVEYWIINLEV